MAYKNKLVKYYSKRDFTKTTEPRGEYEIRNKEPIFVIQKHQASRLHYDFRIESDGVLKSWAIPKGPSTDPSVKRLAMPTEDHPIEYADFEGVIPEGEYGGGTMIVWDSGIYKIMNTERKNGQSNVEDFLNAGKLEIWLEGKKLSGCYALIRTGKGDKPRWLLIKKNDEMADRTHDITINNPASVISGKTIEEMEIKNRK